eukprot:3750475-Rhodomonas_salina.1
MEHQQQQQRRQPGKATSDTAWEGCKKRNSTSCHYAARTMVCGNELLGEHYELSTRSVNV